MLLDTLLAVRRHSEALIAPLEPEDLMLQGMADASPPKWHLGHTTWFFDTFVLQPHAAGPIRTSRSLCICFCRQTDPKDCAQELRRHEIRRTTSGNQAAT